MNKHTPGPWITYEMATHDLLVRHMISGHRTAAVAGIALSGNNTSDKANADLIAAAPDMAEALRNFVGFAEYHEMEKKNPRLQLQLLEMRRALAKAGL